MLRPFRRNSFRAFVQAFEIFKTDTANRTHQRVHELKKSDRILPFFIIFYIPKIVFLGTVIFSLLLIC